MARNRLGGAAAGRGSRGRRSITDRALNRVGSSRARAVRQPLVQRPPERHQRDDRVRAPYSAGRMSSVIPASMTTWRPPRSRTCRTRARSQPRARRVPAGLDGEARRRRSRHARAASGNFSGEPLGHGGSRSPIAPTGNPPPRSSASNPSIERKAEEGERGEPLGRRRATRPSRRAATRRGGDAPRPQRADRTADPVTRAVELGLGHAELRATGADGQTRGGLGRDVGIEPERGRRSMYDRHSRAGPPSERRQDRGLLFAIRGLPSGVDRLAAARAAARRSPRTCRSPRA